MLIDLPFSADWQGSESGMETRSCCSPDVSDYEKFSKCVAFADLGRGLNDRFLGLSNGFNVTAS